MVDSRYLTCKIIDWHTCVRERERDRGREREREKEALFFKPRSRMELQMIEIWQDSTTMYRRYQFDF